MARSDAPNFLFRRVRVSGEVSGLSVVVTNQEREKSMALPGVQVKILNGY